MSGVSARRDICFKQTAERDLLADIALPAGGEWRNTVILHVHGGVWNRGERTFFDDRCHAFAERGFPSLTVDYRWSGEATYPAALHDVQSAVRWVRTEEPCGTTSQRVILCGHSAGAHLTALVAASEKRRDPPVDGYGDTPCSVDGLVCFDGPYDLLGAEENSETADFMGGQPTDVPQLYREASPPEQVTSEHPPTLLYHAKDDEWLTLRET